MLSQHFFTYIRFGIIFSLFLIGQNILYAQRHHVRNYSLESGLPQSEVEAMTIGMDSSLWFGTNGGGLTRFNGKYFKTYTKKDGLASDVVFDAFFDSKGTLWTGHRGKISAFDGRNFTVYEDIPGFEDVHFGDIFEDNQKRVYFQGVHMSSKAYKFFRKDGDKFTPLHDTQAEIKGRDFFYAYADVDKNLSFFVGDTTYVERDGKMISQLSPLAGRFSSMWLLGYDNGGKTWLLIRPKKEHGFKVYTVLDGKVEEVKIPGLGHHAVTNILEDKNGIIWLTLFKAGVMAYDRKTGTSTIYNEKNGLPDNDIQGILLDHENNIWLSINGHGVSMLTNFSFQSVTQADGLPSALVRSIFHDSHDRYWFGDANGNLSYLKDEKVHVMSLPFNPMKIGIIRSFAELPDGDILVQSIHGIWRTDGKNIRKINKELGLDKETKVSFMESDSQGLWIASINKGLIRHENGKTRYFNKESGDLLYDNVESIKSDSKGNLWIGYWGEGVSRLTVNQNPVAETGNSYEFEHYNPACLHDSYVIQTTEDAHGNIWMATFGNGLVRFDGKDFIHYKEKDGLSSELLYSIIKDNDNNLWVGNQQGIDLIRVDSSGLVSVKNYGENEGVVGVETNATANHIDHDGAVWFGTIKGAVKAVPGNSKVNKTPPAVHITKVKLFYKFVDWDKGPTNDFEFDSQDRWTGVPRGLCLDHDQNHITIGFEGISYKVPEKVRYQWKLEGFDRDWSPLTHYTHAVYANLLAGSYLFKVRAKNNDGIWSEVVEYPFTIEAAWWTRPISKLIFMSLFFFAILGAFRWRTQQLRLRQKQLKDEVKNRTLQIRMKNFEILSKNLELERQKTEISDKADELADSYKSLSRLNALERGIMSELKAGKIVDTVYEKVNLLLSADVLMIGLYNHEKNSIDIRGAIEKGEKLPFISISLDDENSLAAKCFKEQKAILINDFKHKQNEEDNNTPVTEGEITDSIIFVPMHLNNRKMGIISVQSFQPNAFKDHHVDLLKNLSICTQVALENAEAYKAIEKQNEKIEEQNVALRDLNQEKNDLIGMVAHDLRNPLTSALTLCGVLKDDGLDEDQTECVMVIDKALRRMNDMIENILDIKAIESQKINIDWESVNIKDAVNETLIGFEGSLERKGIETVVDYTAGCSSISVDRNLFTQVVENLVSNAIKFSANGSKIFLATSIINGRCVLEIRDQGPGISDHDKKQLFMKYKRLSAKPTAGESSTGLGLSIVKKYVEAMGGQVWCESEIKQGATFFVAFAICELDKNLSATSHENGLG
ncbi:hypothetical protein FUAX_51480 (plasmid) [Fulvitalea axinellae]|uniref:histidine kinase n=1 Tax=Fulvitalea axinellae TaxID=1182444 RepID=A0AAU9DHZ4_9BACT|nr:hypothetical protein FUAX_51480 [Fulvitalea axinellae]